VALRRLVDAGFRLAIVTNQSGIGRGYFDTAAFERFQARLLADLAQAGVAIDANFLCPHARPS
jgi:histidinol phosphatase-like enzyme